MLTQQNPSTQVAAHAHDAAQGGLPQRPGVTPTPLLPILAFTFLNSIGSAVIYSGIYTLAKFQYGFGTLDNYLLALLYGATYVPAALGVGKLMAFLDRSGRISHRAVLAAIVLCMALLCWVPSLAAWLDGPGVNRSWPIWVVCGIYSPLSGMMWPMIEAYVSGGRRGEELRRAIGRFNIAWSSALVVTLILISGWVKEHPLLILQLLGGVHALTALCVLWFKPRPGEHAHDHEPHPPVYDRLLAALQVLLPVAFLGISTISPYLTSAFASLEVPPTWETRVIAVWMTARVITFALMERFHGWHGRWWLPIAGICLLLLALAAVVLSPVLFSPPTGLVVLIGGLVGFGVGVGMIYAATLYYSMEVGSSQVEAGGIFETLIGVGYTLGPICGLAGAAAVQWGQAGPATGNAVTLALVGVLALAGVAVALRRAASYRPEASL